MNLTNSRPVILVGAGKMGLALARGWLASGLAAPALTLVDPMPAPLAETFAKTNDLKLAGEIPEGAEGILVLAVKPQIMAAVLAAARPRIGTDCLILSIAAGISIAALEKGLGTSRIVRTMPNTPAQIGKGITGAVAASGATPADRQTADALLAAAGSVVWFENEGSLDAVTALSGSGPAYLFYLVEAMAEAGIAEGLGADEAMQLARQTVIGAAALMDADPLPAATLRENVTSPGGTTAAALAILRGENGLSPLMRRAIHAARKKSEELGK